MNADINLRLAYGLLDLACTMLAPNFITAAAEWLDRRVGY